MRLIDADEFDRELYAEQMKRENDEWVYGYKLFEAIRIDLRNRPTVDAVPLDKLCELCEEAGARVPCVICSKIMPEWCKKNNNLPLSWDEEYKCPSWKAVLTKWMEEQDADRQ